MKSMCTRLFLLIFVATGCASRVLQYDKSDEALKNEEYENKMHVAPAEPPPGPVITEVSPPAPESPAAATATAVAAKNKASGKKLVKKSNQELAAEAKIAAAAAKPHVPGPHLPDIEDKEGFVERRPTKDPFRAGEKVTLDLSYFNIVAGTMEIAVKPMVNVNGAKAYHFEVTAQSNSFFNHIYGVDDKAVTYLGYEDMRPANLQITLKESKQLAEARTFFDWKTNKASYWQKRVTKESGEESKKLDWDIQPFSQNVISAAFYMRTFQYEIGKKLAFRVADEGKNIVFKGEVIRKEKLSTAIGELNTIVIKPILTVDGVFTPVGEILVWLTDDDRKFIVRLESKIKIGTIVAKLKSLEKGQE